MASNHADVMHWFPKFGKSMDTFRTDVSKAMGGASNGDSGGSTGSGAQDFEPYTVRVKVTELRIRKGPGTDTDALGFIKPGVYTIEEEANGPGAKKWGRLKSGAGWIALDFAEKC